MEHHLIARLEGKAVRLNVVEVGLMALGQINPETFDGVAGADTD